MALVILAIEACPMTREDGNASGRFSFAEVPKVIHYHALSVGQFEFLEVGSEMNLRSRVFPYASIKNLKTMAIVTAVIDVMEREKVCCCFLQRERNLDLQTGRELHDCYLILI